MITLCFNSLVVSYNYDLPVKYNVDALVALSRACVQVQVFVCVSLCVYMHVHYMCLYVRQGVSVYSTKIYCDCISMCMHILLREQVLVSVCVCVCVMYPVYQCMACKRNYCIPPLGSESVWAKKRVKRT